MSHDTARTTARPDLLILDALPAPVFIVQQQRYAYVNGAFADLLGVDRGKLEGQDAWQHIHPDDRRIAPRDPASDDGLEPGGLTQVRVRRSDGAERSVAMQVVRFTYGGAPAWLGTAQDVTAHLDATTIAVRMAALGRLAGGVAHDFNNLLLVVGGQLERLRHLVPHDGDAHRALEAVATAAERASLLTDQLLSFGRRQMLTPQILDLPAFLHEIAPQLQARLGADVEVVVDCRAALPDVRADRPRLREVFWHLADNARDAMPHGGRLTIAVDDVIVDSDLKARWAFLAVGGEFVRVRVTDTGAGMHPDVTPHVFEPFFTTKGRGRGAGMGLASVYGIVKQSAGYVFVERTGASGTCLTILLPPARVAERSATTWPPAKATPRESDEIRVLLVEDDMAVRELLVDVLDARGFSVAAAETAEQAELLARERVFDVLVSDIDLPGMSGARLGASLAARMPALRIILMSGYPDDGEITRAGLHERALLLRKPFPTATLVDHIRQMTQAS